MAKSYNVFPQQPTNIPLANGSGKVGQIVPTLILMQSWFNDIGYTVEEEDESIVLRGHGNVFRSDLESLPRIFGDLRKQIT